MNAKLGLVGAAAAAFMIAGGSSAGAADAAGYHPPAKRAPPLIAYVESIKPTGPTPRLANGKPDLTGQWDGIFPGAIKDRSNAARIIDRIPFTRSHLFNRPMYKPEYWAKVEALDFGKWNTDPARQNCAPLGVPRAVIQPTILMTEKQAWFSKSGGGPNAAAENTVRAVPLDGRKHGPDDADQTTYQGVGVGHWDGDTLVVDSTGFNDSSWLGWAGYFHSDRMSLVERFRRVGDLLYYNYTVTDPVVLSQPFTSLTVVWKLNPDPNIVMSEPTSCTPTELDDHIVDPYLR